MRSTYNVPRNVLERLEELEVLTPGPRGYDADDVAIIEAISRFRAGGYEEALGFTIYDTLRYREALEPLVAEEVRVLLDRVPDLEDLLTRPVGEVGDPLEVQHLRRVHGPDGAGWAPILLAELRRHRERAGPGD